MIPTPLNSIDLGSDSELGWISLTQTDLGPELPRAEMTWISLNVQGPEEDPGEEMSWRCL